MVNEEGFVITKYSTNEDLRSFWGEVLYRLPLADPNAASCVEPVLPLNPDASSVAMAIATTWRCELNSKPYFLYDPRLMKDEQLIERGLLEIEALCYIRGRSIPNRFFVLDEAQQLTPLEAKTVVTRMSRGSKLVMVGDPAQIDNPYVDSRSNGLVYTRNRLRGHALTAHISLTKGERSPLAEIGASRM